MHVAAFCSPLSPDWRWRIVGYDGEMVAESHQTLSTIADAGANGTQRLFQYVPPRLGAGPSLGAGGPGEMLDAVGFALRESRAAADMICPAWQ